MYLIFWTARFLGDESEEEESSPKLSQAQLILQKIHERAQERKRRASEQNTEINDGETKDTISSKRSRKDSVTDEPDQKNSGTKRKKSLESKDVKEITAGQTTDTDGDVSSKKKLQKKDKKSKSKFEAGSDAGEDEIHKQPEEDKDSGVEAESDGEARIESDNEEEDQQTGQPHREIGGFTVIGDVKKRKVQKVSEKVLSLWGQFIFRYRCLNR